MALSTYYAHENILCARRGGVPMLVILPSLSVFLAILEGLNTLGPVFRGFGGLLKFGPLAHEEMHA